MNGLQSIQRSTKFCRSNETLRVRKYWRNGGSSDSDGLVFASLSELWSETIVPCGGMAANALGLISQVPVRQVHLTSGPNRKLNLGGLVVELRHAPRWQMVAPHRPAGDAVRALAWLGPEEVEENLGVIEKRLSPRDLEELAATRAVMPAWLAEPVSTMVADS